MKTEFNQDKDNSMNSEEGEYIASPNNLETLKHETPKMQSSYSRESKS